MNKYHDVVNIQFDKNNLYLRVDGKSYQFDLREHSQMLFKASEEQRLNFEISPSGYGIHWPLIDEDLSIDGLLGIKHFAPKKEKVIR